MIVTLVDCDGLPRSNASTTNRNSDGGSGKVETDLVSVIRPFDSSIPKIPTLGEMCREAV